MYSTGKVCGCGGDVEYVEGRGEGVWKEEGKVCGRKGGRCVEGRGEGEGEKRVGKVDRLKREKDGGRGEQ